MPVPSCGDPFKRWTGLKRALASTYRDIVDNRTLQMAAALSYYLVLSVFPALILFFAVVASIPFPSLYTRVFAFIFTLLPAQTVPMVQSVLLDVATNHGALLSLGTIGTIRGASSAFDGMIEALDVAYELRDLRPLWKTRILALGLAATSVCLLLSGLTIMILGPQFGAWLASRMALPAHFAALWPVFHWTAAVGIALLAVELFFLAPNVKQRHCRAECLPFCAGLAFPTY